MPTSPRSLPRSSGSTAALLLLTAALGAACLAGAAAPAVAGAAGVQPAAEEPTVRVLVRFHQGLGARERHLLDEVGAGLRRDFGTARVAAVELPAGRVAALRADPAVALVEPEPVYRPLARRGGGGEIVPSPGNGLYGLVLTRSLLPHGRGVTGRGVKLCAVDSGIDAKHLDIAPNYRGGIDTRAGDGNPDVGTNAAEGFHGTMVAGVLAGAVNGFGVRGAAPQAELYHARAMGAESGASSDILEGLRHLVEDRGCRVVNLSLGHGTHSTIEEDLYRSLVEAHDVLIVAAAGNEGGESRIYPAGYPSVVAVGAVDGDPGLAGFSNRGPWVDLVAPGVAILSTAPRGSGREGYVQVGKRRLAGIPLTYSGSTGGPLPAAMVDCGTGNTAAEFPRAVRGAIALMRRGDAFFSVKVENAMRAGAAGAIIYNHEPGGFNGTLQTPKASNGKPWIPAIGISLADGEALRGSRAAIKLAVDATDFATANGTSFASPYVAAIAALVRSVAPHLSAAEVRAVLTDTATDLGDPGRDDLFGWGLVDAEAATRAAAQR